MAIDSRSMAAPRRSSWRNARSSKKSMRSPGHWHKGSSGAGQKLATPRTRNHYQYHLPCGRHLDATWTAPVPGLAQPCGWSGSERLWGPKGECPRTNYLNQGFVWVLFKYDWGQGMIFGIEGESSMDRGFEVQSPCCRFWRLCLVQFAWQCISNSELPWITIFRANF